MSQDQPMQYDADGMHIEPVSGLTWAEIGMRLMLGYGPPAGVEINHQTVPSYLQRDVRFLDYLAALDGVGHMWRLEEESYPAGRDGALADRYRCETCPAVRAVPAGSGPPDEIIEP